MNIQLQIHNSKAVHTVVTFIAPWLVIKEEHCITLGSDDTYDYSFVRMSKT